MSDCTVMRESMPLLLTESLDPVRRENAYQHIEHCDACGEEWNGFRETWTLLETLPEVDVPPSVKQKFLGTINAQPETNVVPFHRRPAVRWLAQAAAVVIIAGGSYFAGHQRTEPRVIETPTTPATITSMTPAPSVQPVAFSIAESRVLPASAINPVIEGRPDIQNFIGTLPQNPNDPVRVSFDITQHVTVTGRPTDKAIQGLASYALKNEDRMSPTGPRAIEWVRAVYSQPSYATPEMTAALANVLRNDTHAGVRISAVETLTSVPVAAATNDMRDALIQALKNDPNPAVRLKAIEGLANLMKKSGHPDALALASLREKAAQEDENMYIRMQASEALGRVQP